MPSSPDKPDRLFQAILEDPDNDEPRLVWADREGGDRGELVTLQCLLARREGPREQRVRMAKRVRELLPRFDTARERHERGFVERVLVLPEELGPQLFERNPLVRTLDLRSPDIPSGKTADELWPEFADRLAKGFARLPPGRIRRLEANPEISVHDEDASSKRYFGDELAAVIAQASTLAGVRQLRLIAGNVTRAAIPHLARLPELASLEGGTALDGAGCALLLAAVPTLRFFAPFNNAYQLHGEELATLLAAPATHRLAGLDLWTNGLDDADLARLAATPFARLERLGVGNCQDWTQGALDGLAAAPALQGLVDLDVLDAPGRTPSVFCRAPFAIRRLRVSPVDEQMLPILEAAPALDWLVVDHNSKHIPHLRETIPWVNDGYSL